MSSSLARKERKREREGEREWGKEREGARERQQAEEGGVDELLPSLNSTEYPDV